MADYVMELIVAAIGQIYFLEGYKKSQHKKNS